MKNESLDHDDQTTEGNGAVDRSLKVSDGFESQLKEIGVLERELDPAEPAQSLTPVDARVWLTTEPAPLDPVLEGLFDRGDKVAVVAASKMRKTFMFIQMALCLAAGSTFLKWTTPKRRRVLLVQLEVKPAHFHRRVRRVAKALGIEPGDIEDRLYILNLRGVSVDLSGIEQLARALGVDVIILDPLYKFIEGDENASQDMKPLLQRFDQIAERVGAALVYIHHDAKGSPGDRNIRDRGSGSNTLVRDCDVLITLTAHQNEDTDIAVVGMLQRNYPPQEDFSIRWREGVFEVAEDVPAVAAKSSSQGNRNPTTNTHLEHFLPEVERVLDGCAMKKAVLTDKVRTKTGLTVTRAKALVELALDGDKYISWDRCYPRAVWIGTEEAIDTKIKKNEGRKQKRLFDHTGKQKKQTGKKSQ